MLTLCPSIYKKYHTMYICAKHPEIFLSHVVVIHCHSIIPNLLHHNFFNFALFHGRVMVRINFHPSSCCHPSSSFLMISAGVRSNSLAIKRCLGVTINSRQGRAHDDPHAGGGSFGSDLCNMEVFWGKNS